MHLYGTGTLDKCLWYAESPSDDGVDEADPGQDIPHAHHNAHGLV